MNTSIELHDSDCLAVDIDSRCNGAVLLNAYVHRTDGEPGISNGEGGVQRIRLGVGVMEVEGEVGDLPACIYEGSVAIGTLVQDNMIPFPAKYSEAVRITLMLAEDARVIVVSGIGLLIEAEGDFRFVEPVDFSRS